MISITQDNTEMVVTIDGQGVLKTNNWVLTWGAGSKWAAALLVEHMQNALEAELSRIRKEAYDLGWKHAKSKKVPKWRTFHGGW